MKSKTNLLAWVLTLVLICLPFAAFTSCGDDADDDSQSMSLTLNAGETHNIGKDSNWKSSNPIVASVSGSTITANCMGSTTITSGSSTIKVTVKATNFEFKDPCTQWGASMNTVKSFMSSYDLKKETDTSVYYYGTGKTFLYVYNFENNKLTDSYYYVKYYYSDDIVDYLKQRFYPFTTKDDVIFMINAKQDMVALVSAVSTGNTAYVMVMYAPYTGEKIFKSAKLHKVAKASSSEEIAAFNSLKEKLAPNM